MKVTDEGLFVMISASMSQIFIDNYEESLGSPLPLRVIG